jgi:hypothetical protein
VSTETPDQASRRRAGIKDYTCGLCAEEFGSNCQPGDIECTNDDCEARLCPCCGAWFNEDGDSSQEPHAVPELAEIDPDKLDLLAAWFDLEDARRGRAGLPEVQADLRRWAKLVRGIRERAGVTS